MTTAFHKLRNSQDNPPVFAGVDVPGLSKDTCYDLHVATENNEKAVVVTLLTSGCGVNTLDSSGRTSLQIAAAKGYLDIAKVLIQHGADVNYQDKTCGNTALHEACWSGFSQMVATLAGAKANMTLANIGGFSPIHLCCQNGHNQSCRELLFGGCSPNLKNNYGDTPLHTSARYGHAGVARILISACCQVSEQNKNGDTALHIAAAMGRRKLTTIFLESGCDKKLRNKQHERACDIANRKDMKEVVKILCASSSLKNKKEGLLKKTRDKSSNRADGTSHQKKHSKKVERGVFGSGGKEWSPYGCHYYPDSSAFPQPKLSSLPGEPLSKGEQYYLDLAGNIRKGPVGVGYTCYCAPFFRDIEARMRDDKKEMMNHMSCTERRLEKKVQRTQGQLSVLTHWLRKEVGLLRTRSLDRLLEADNNQASQPKNSSVGNICDGEEDLLKIAEMRLHEGQVVKGTKQVSADQLDTPGKKESAGASEDKPCGLQEYYDIELENEVGSSQTHQSNQICCAEIPNRESLLRKTFPVVGASRSRFESHEHINSPREWLRLNDGPYMVRTDREVDVHRDELACNESNAEKYKAIQTWQNVGMLPYRSRKAVYSPMLDYDVNDSGYSTKVCDCSPPPLAANPITNTQVSFL